MYGALSWLQESLVELLLHDLRAVAGRPAGPVSAPAVRLGRVNDAPIGIFDSGVGGLTVARSILDQLPHESDRSTSGTPLNTPYGSKPLAAVRAHALEVMDDLVDAGVKLLVIACNTASSAMLRDARERYTLRRGIPVVEVILPAARRAVAATRRAGSASSPPSPRSSRAPTTTRSPWRPGVELTTQACPRVRPSWSRRASRPAPRCWRSRTSTSTRSARPGVDTLVLGCTHYPLLTGAISYVMGEEVTLVSSAEETAKDVYRTLVAHDLERDPAAGPPVHRFLATGDPDAVPHPRAPVPRARGRGRRAQRGACDEAHRPGLRRAPSRAPTRRRRATSCRPTTPTGARGRSCSTSATAR